MAQRYNTQVQGNSECAYESNFHTSETPSIAPLTSLFSSSSSHTAALMYVLTQERKRMTARETLSLSLSLALREGDDGENGINECIHSANRATSDAETKFWQMTPFTIVNEVMMVL